MPVVTFEGLDGVGKTTTAAALAECANGITSSMMPDFEAMVPERAMIKAGDDIDERFHYFVALNTRQMAWAKEQAEGGTMVALDSGIHRTVATHKALGSQAAHNYHVPTHLRPDRGFLLQLDEPRRVERLVGRDGALVFTTHWDEMLFTRSEHVLHSYRYGPNRLMLINAKRPVERIIEKVLDHVKV